MASWPDRPPDGLVRRLAAFGVPHWMAAPAGRPAGRLAGSPEEDSCAEDVEPTEPRPARRQSERWATNTDPDTDPSLATDSIVQIHHPRSLLGSRPSDSSSTTHYVLRYGHVLGHSTGVRGRRLRFMPGLLDLLRARSRQSPNAKHAFPNRYNECADQKPSHRASSLPPMKGDNLSSANPANRPPHQIEQAEHQLRIS